MKLKEKLFIFLMAIESDTNECPLYFLVPCCFAYNKLFIQNEGIMIFPDLPLIWINSVLTTDFTAGFLLSFKWGHDVGLFFGLSVEANAGVCWNHSTCHHVILETNVCRLKQ